MTNKQCVVIFPIYKIPNSVEQKFFENGLEKTLGFEQIVIAPYNFNTNSLTGKLKNIKIERFDDTYFKNIKGYNKLLLSLEFYTRFINYEYILIHQADVYLFNDNLKYWCDCKYHYIGAPWFKSNKLNRGIFFNFFYSNIYQPFLVKKRKNGWLYNKVGNGGLSLRNTKKAIEILDNCPKKLLNKYINSDSPHYNEDVFWSIEARKIDKKFKIPNWKVALNFAIELDPEAAIKENLYRLPFGCHAPSLINKSFWMNYIPSLEI